MSMTSYINIKKISIKKNPLIKRLLKNKILSITIFFGFLLLLTSIILLIISPAFSVNSLPAPTVNLESNLTNQYSPKIAISENQGIFIKHAQKRFYSVNNYVNVKNIEEGKQKFQVHSMREYYFFKLISKQSTNVEIEFDYAAPEIVEIENIKDEYYSTENTINFKSKELPIIITYKLDNVELTSEFPAILPEAKPSLETVNIEPKNTLPCSQNKPNPDSELYSYSCILSLPEERQYQITLSVADKANNKHFLFDNKTIAYVAPVSLLCTEVPSATNQKELSKTCTVTKDGYLFQGEEKISLKKDQQIEYMFLLENEGENIIVIKTGDEQGREFEQKVKIILDTVVPVFTKVSIPDTYTVCDFDRLFENFDACKKKYQSLSKITITFAANEKISGTLITKPRLYPGTSGKGATSDSFTLDANQEYTKTIDGSNYWGGYPNSGGVNFDVIVEITAFDTAGNKTYFTKTVTVVLKF